MIKVSNIRKFKMEPLGKHPEEAVEVLKRGISVLEKHCKYWVSAGTALGIVRDDSLIPWDTDIDVEVLCDDLTVALMIQLEEAGFQQIRLQFDDRTMDPSQIAFKDKDTGIIFDIFCYKKVGDQYVNENEHGTLTVPARFLDELEDHDFQGKTVRLPSPAQEYLEYRYGKDWNKPTGAKGKWEEQANNLK